MGIKFEILPGQSEEGTRPPFKNLLRKDITLFGNSFSNRKKESFYGRMGVLLRSGISLKKSLELLSESQKRQKDRDFISTLSQEIVTGKYLHQVLKDNDRFTPYEYHAIKIGEQTGRLGEITEELFQFFKQKNEQKRLIYSALSYPGIILFTAMAVVYFMMAFVVPMFIDIFRQNKVELPWITQVIVDISGFVGSYGYLMLLFLLSGIFTFRYLKHQPVFRKKRDLFLLKIPILGGYLKKVYVTRFIQAMALLTSAKIPMVSGIALVKEMINFYPLQNSLKQIEENIINGKKMSECFADHSIYDKDLVALLKVAEETNQSEFIFQKLYQQYSEDLKYSSQIITSLLNPIFISLVAVIVGVILVAMYLPMFKLSSVIG